MLARDFDGIAFGLSARLRLIERRSLRGLGIVLRVFWFYGLHAGLKVLGIAFRVDVHRARLPTSFASKLAGALFGQNHTCPS
jgi:hypothetical protein